MMNKILKYISVVVLLSGALSCDEYLDQTEYADVSDVNIFETYPLFTGFVDQCYRKMMDHAAEDRFGLNWGDHMIDNRGHYCASRIQSGDYWGAISPFWAGIIINDRANYEFDGLWPDSWFGIRVCNVGLAHLDELVEYQGDQKDWIKGQLLFFRAFFHQEIISMWGGMPYIDEVIEPNDPMDKSRDTYHENAERIIADLLEAAELLPIEWKDNNVITSPELIDGNLTSQNTGRITRGAAYALAAKAALFAGSPLMNGSSTGSYTYHEEYMKRASEYAWEVLKLADQGAYALVPFEDYGDMFGRNDGTRVWTSETILQKIQSGPGTWRVTNTHGMNFGCAFVTPAYQLGGGTQKRTPTQNIVDMFETTNGLPIDEDPSYDPLNPWENRDPRLRQNIIVDRDAFIIAEPNVLMELYEGGITKTYNAGLTAYFCKKYQPLGTNLIDNRTDKFTYSCPFIRLAEVYLIYAEAVNEYIGPTTTPDFATMTASEAVNKVRARPGLDMPPVDSRVSNMEDLRDIIWNERSVELCFETQRWVDLRRWYVAEKDEYKKLYDLSFDKDWTYFNKKLIREVVFDKKHYWLPIPREQTYLNENFKQNPGW